MALTVRRAEINDADAAGRLQVDAWRFTYGGFLPDAYLAGLSYDQFIEKWRDAIFKNDPAVPHWVAYLGNELVGILTASPARLEVPGYPHELNAIYTKPGLQRAGIGRALFGAYFAWLRETKRDSFHLWAGRQNERAHRLYEALGGRKVAERDDRVFGGMRIVEWAFGWDSVPPSP